MATHFLDVPPFDLLQLLHELPGATLATLQQVPADLGQRGGGLRKAGVDVPDELELHVDIPYPAENAAHSPHDRGATVHVLVPRMASDDVERSANPPRRDPGGSP